MLKLVKVFKQLKTTIATIEKCVAKSSYTTYILKLKLPRSARVSKTDAEIKKVATMKKSDV